MIFFNEHPSYYARQAFVATDPASGSIQIDAACDVLDIEVFRDGEKIDAVSVTLNGMPEAEFQALTTATVVGLMAKHGIRLAKRHPDTKYNARLGHVNIGGMPITTAYRVSKNADEVKPTWSPDDFAQITRYTIHTPAGPDVLVCVPRSQSDAAAAYAAERIATAAHAYRCSHQAGRGGFEPVEAVVSDRLATTAPPAVRSGRITGGLTPKTIVEALDRSVHGQREAKEILAIAAYQHTRRTQIATPGFRKSNVFLVGPTGSGKTYLAENLARALNVPYCIFDVSRMTPSGFYGDSVDDLAKAIVAAADDDTDKAAKSIVVLDEFDKLCAGNSNSQYKTREMATFGPTTQQQLLKFIEGDTFRSEGSSMRQVALNTKNILFIASGAFAHMPPGTPTSEWLIEAGLIPELVGRFPVRITLDELKAPDLVAAARLSGGAVEEYSSLLKMDNITLDVGQDALDVMASAAVAQKTGVRGMREIFERVLRPVMFSPDQYTGKTFTLTPDMVFERLSARA